MHFTYTVEVDVERVQGKFTTRDEISEAIITALEQVQSDIDLDSLGPDSNSEYEVTDFSINEEEQAKRR